MVVKPPKVFTQADIDKAVADTKAASERENMTAVLPSKTEAIFTRHARVSQNLLFAVSEWAEWRKRNNILSTGAYEAGVLEALYDVDHSMASVRQTSKTRMQTFLMTGIDINNTWTTFSSYDEVIDYAEWLDVENIPHPHSIVGTPALRQSMEDWYKKMDIDSLVQFPRQYKMLMGFVIDWQEDDE